MARYCCAFRGYSSSRSEIESGAAARFLRLGFHAKGEAMETSPPINPFVKLALEFAPLAIFFIANGRLGIFAATGVFMMAILVSLIVSYALTRKLPIMALVSAGVVLVFGSLTLLLHDDLFIKMKPTIVNSLFGVVLLGGLAFGKPLLPLVLDQVLTLTDAGWRKLTLRWALFFFVLAALNEIVWRNFSTDVWVDFKVFGTMPLTLLFALSQTPLILRHGEET
jgi:intracellular septation protein